jgi:AcrR family transcriptional regulator
MELFEMNGYGATTVEQIADRAGVSMRTFYRYCTGKDDAITLGLGAAPAQLAESISAYRGRALIDAVLEGFVDTIEIPGADVVRHRRLLKVIVDTEALRGTWLAAGRTAQESLSVFFASRRPELSVIACRALAAATTAALTVAIESWARGEQATIRAAATQALDVIAPALRD